MKKCIFAIVLFLAANILSAKPYTRINPFSFPHSNSYSISYTMLDFNNLAAYFGTSGTFNNNPYLQNGPGLYWPKGSGLTACFTAGFSIAAKINGQLAETMCSYKGEYTAGYIANGHAFTNDDFKFYSVKYGDNIYNNPDYANWYKMVPYGAPYVDVNHNGVYDRGIDKPGLSYASQTIFACLTDGFAWSHNSGEGFGGGVTNPLLMSEVHLTAFTYDAPGMDDIQYIKWEVFNKGAYRWDSTYFAVIADVDLGYGYDDYIGCDTTRNLGYCYNGSDSDMYYGTHPPAFGMRILRGPIDSAHNSDTLMLTSFTHFIGPMSGWIWCESDPNGEPLPAYNFLRGFKKDGTPFLNPTIPLGQGTRKTKFVFPGDPETNAGWTMMKGTMNNCGGDTIGVLDTLGPGDLRYTMASGSDSLTVYPGQKQTICISQLIARGSSNLNSVTRLKRLSDLANWVFRNFINNEEVTVINPVLPEKFSLSQNYPNPFNPVTNIKYQIPFETYVDISLYDISGRLIKKLVSENKTAGFYEMTFDASGLSSGIYFYTINASYFTDSKKMAVVK